MLNRLHPINIWPNLSFMWNFWKIHSILPDFDILVSLNIIDFSLVNLKFTWMEGLLRVFVRCKWNQGRIQDFKLGGTHLKKWRERREAPKLLWYFVWKITILRQKNHIFPILGGAHEIFGVFHVKNHDFKPKKSYFFQF